MSDSVRPHRRSPPGSPVPGILQARMWSGLPFPSPMHESESEVPQSCPTLSDPMDYSSLGPSIHGIFQVRVLEWVAIAFSHSQTAWGQILALLFIIGGAVGKESACNAKRREMWVRKIPWRRKWQPTAVFLPGKFHGQRSLVATVHAVAKSRTRTESGQSDTGCLEQVGLLLCFSFLI